MSAGHLWLIEARFVDRYRTELGLAGGSKLGTKLRPAELRRFADGASTGTGSEDTARRDSNSFQLTSRELSPSFVRKERSSRPGED
jgi:hypothetical protein